jgi:rhodanese-related sulfurtransferase
MEASPAISAQDEMQTILSRLPGARRALFAACHIGGCQSCAYQDDESLASVCERNEISVEEAIAYLLKSHEHDLEMLVAPADLKARLDAGEAILLVDTRTREEHEAVALPDSKLMTQEYQQSLFGTSPEQQIVLYDHNGREALDHCAWFRGHGLKNTLALTGGIDAWSREVDSSVPRYKIEME